MNLNKLSHRQVSLIKRILEISYLKKFSHIGSCLSSVSTISQIFDIKTPQDKFILSNGHAGIALYVNLESIGYNCLSNLDNICVHPNMNQDFGIDVSTGSLGQGIPIGIGMALAKPEQNIYCLSSDGEFNEGSIWESLGVIQKYKIKNIHISVISNGWGALDQISTEDLKSKIRGFGFNLISANAYDLVEIRNSILYQSNHQPTIVVIDSHETIFPFLHDITAHYHVMSQSDYQLALQSLNV